MIAWLALISPARGLESTVRGRPSSATESWDASSEMSDSHSARSANDDEMYRNAYKELKRIASHHLRAMSEGATLSTTELVHEAYLKLRGSSNTEWEGRAHFFGAASRAMRQVLVDFA